jgi:hypothetical protein
MSWCKSETENQESRKMALPGKKNKKIDASRCIDKK